MCFPWTLTVSAALGIAGLASYTMHLAGALVVVTSVVAMGEPLRVARFFDVLLGLAVTIVP